MSFYMKFVKVSVYMKFRINLFSKKYSKGFKVGKKGILLFFGLMVAIVVIAFLSFDKSHIEDTNGDLTTLETMTTNDIAKNWYDYNAKNLCIRTTSSSECSYISGSSGSGPHEDTKYDAKYSATLLSGTIFIRAIRINSGEQLIISLTTELTSGNMEVILMDPDGNIEHEFLLNTTDSISLSNTTIGYYYVIMGGESAEFELDIDTEVN